MPNRPSRLHAAFRCGAALFMLAACAPASAPDHETRAQPGTGGTSATAGAGGAGAMRGAGAGGAQGTGGVRASGADDAGAGQGGGRDASSASAGGAPASGGSGGDAGQPGPVEIVPSENAGKYAIAFDDVRFVVDAQFGARVIEFSLAGQNLLTGRDADADNWGSTCWPSPQQRWNWPPVPELDTQAYDAAIERDVIALDSAPGVRAQVRVGKRIRGLADEGAIELTYALTNTGDAAASWAPWEVTRVAAGGLTFFPSGEQVISSALAVTNRDGITWYAHDAAALASGGQKYTADGSEGWLAHVAGDTLFVKQFADVAPAEQAPAPEAEIGIYAAAKYVELEPQGPYTSLMPGESVSWRVRWYVRALPRDVAPALGNAALVAFVRTLLDH